VLLVVFSIVVLLGAATRMGSAPRNWQRFTIAALHRNLSLFAVMLLVLHVATAVADPYVNIGWAATIVPAMSSYRTAAIALGALALDIGAAVMFTSLLRRRIGYRAWRCIHWAAYLAWPVAFVHSLQAANDLGRAWVTAIEWGSASIVATAVVARALYAIRPPLERRRTAALARSPVAGAGRGS
jgi:sulfoxide reductase heme-binding subunit YedZ